LMKFQASDSSPKKPARDPMIAIRGGLLDIAGFWIPVLEPVEGFNAAGSLAVA
jgi:hypothetical protein